MILTHVLCCSKYFIDIDYDVIENSKKCMFYVRDVIRQAHLLYCLALNCLKLNTKLIFNDTFSLTLPRQDIMRDDATLYLSYRFNHLSPPWPSPLHQAHTLNQNRDNDNKVSPYKKMLLPLTLNFLSHGDYSSTSI